MVNLYAPFCVGLYSHLEKVIGWKTTIYVVTYVFLLYLTLLVPKPTLPEAQKTPCNNPPYSTMKFCTLLSYFAPCLVPGAKATKSGSWFQLGWSTSGPGLGPVIQANRKEANQSEGYLYTNNFFLFRGLFLHNIYFSSFIGST